MALLSVEPRARLYCLEFNTAERLGAQATGLADGDGLPRFRGASAGGSFPAESVRVICGIAIIEDRGSTEAVECARNGSSELVHFIIPCSWRDEVSRHGVGRLSIDSLCEVWRG